MQELCGQGCSETDCLSCMVKTRQWQDALVASKPDSRPWKAYYRVLEHFDLQRKSLNKDPGFQQKFREWLEECLEYQPLWVYGGDVWTILSEINKHLQRVPSPDSGLKPWEESFLAIDEPLQSQWDNTQQDVTDAAATLPPTTDSQVGNSDPVLPPAAAAGQPLSTEILGSDDFEEIDNMLATIDAGHPSSYGQQQHAEQLQPFHQQPSAGFDAALPGPAPGQLEMRQAEGSVAAAQLYGTNDQVQHCNHVSSLCLATSKKFVLCNTVTSFCQNIVH